MLLVDVAKDADQDTNSETETRFESGIVHEHIISAHTENTTRCDESETKSHLIVFLRHHFFALIESEWICSCVGNLVYRGNIAEYL